MKILVVCQYYYPENFQITPICEQLVQNGHDVTVLTGRPNYPTGIIPAEYKHGHHEEDINGVHVIRSKEIGRKKGALWLAMNYVSFWHSANYRISFLPSDFDIVFVYQLSPVMMGLPAVKFCRKHNIPLALYCCDLWPESMKMYVGEGNPIFKLFKAISRKVYASCDKIICQSNSFISYMEATHGIERNKLTYIPAFADETYLQQDFTPEDETVDFVFLGNLGIAQDLIMVLNAVEQMKALSGFRVHFVGDGTCLSDMKEFVTEHGLQDIVRFYGRRPVEEMPDFYRLADVCLVSLKADSQVGLTLPSKIQGYMAAGKPIIGMIDGSAKETINEAGCGLCVNASDYVGLARVMKEFVLNSEKYNSCGNNGREYFKAHFTKQIFMDALEKSLKEMCDDTAYKIKERV